jgi:ribosome-binding factor A
MGNVKQKRTAEQIRVLLSELLLHVVDDPRLHSVTITNVNIDREYQHADVYVNALAYDSREQEVMEALQKAQGFLRYELSKRLHLRRLPSMHFHWDMSIQQAFEVTALLDTLDIPPAVDDPTLAE